MNIVSIETARKLRDAGFPQPETVEDGQFWYSCGKDPFYISSELRTGIKPEKWFNCYPAFAPSSTDVLREIYNHFAAMEGYSVDIQLLPTGDGFQVGVFEDLPFDAMKPIWETHENAAEAAALAWLQLNVK